MIYLLYITIGFLSGILNGLIGVGGGIVIIPSLIYIYNYIGVDYSLITYKAISTSLFAIILPTILSAKAHYKNNNIAWDKVSHLIVYLILGTIIGVVLTTQIKPATLNKFFAFFLIIVSVKMFLKKKEHVSSPHNVRYIISSLFAFITGILSGLLGIGGGTMLIPFFNHQGFSIKKSISNSSLLVLIIAISGSLTYIGLNKFSENQYIDYYAAIMISLGSILSTNIGIKLLYALPEKIIYRICAVIFSSIAYKLF